MKKLLLAGVIFLFASGVFAQSGEVFSTEEGAIRGYDPVAYFKEQNAVKGKKEFDYKYKDAVWYFVSADNRATFKSDPEKYSPQYGGYCAYGASDGDGHKAPTEPDAWKIVDDKLYFNYNKKVQALWLKDQSERIKKANKNWPAIKNK